MSLSPRLRHGLKYALSPLLFRYPPFGLQPERLMVWLQTLERTARVPGAVLEVGCSVGGTTAIGHGLMRNLGIEKPYVAIDTFGGFVEGQFGHDVQDGTPAAHRHQFSANSMRLVRRNLARFGAGDVSLVQGDVVTIPTTRLPEQVSACLIDVDLSEPVHAALEKVVPLVSPGGVVLVDDCAEDTDWRARDGYVRYVRSADLPETYWHGFGVVEVGAAT
jgi:O-methyltransferase